MKLAYVHGFNGSHCGNSVNYLKVALPDGWSIDGIEYDEKNLTCEQVRNLIYDYVEANNIDILIGTSLGGFYLSTITDIPKVIINPCWNPIEELPKLDDVDTAWLSSFEKYLDYPYMSDTETKLMTLGYFGSHDELFGNKYHSVFNSCFGDSKVIDCGHQINQDCAFIIMDDIKNVLCKRIKLLSDYDTTMNNT